MEKMSTTQAVAVITGASGGIGAALVQAFKNRNYRIVATSRSIKPCRDEDLVTVQGNVADPNTADRVFKEALDRFGRVDTSSTRYRRNLIRLPACAANAPGSSLGS